MINTPERNDTDCTYKQGTLPQCAPLSAVFIPYQQQDAPKYANTEALTRGTLFPGLDLPFMNVANKNNPYAGTHLGDLMALDFVMKELNLYLDTHKDDEEAFALYQGFLALKQEARERYARLCGPVTQSDMQGMDRYAWLDNPWPWEYTTKREG